MGWGMLREASGMQTPNFGPDGRITLVTGTGRGLGAPAAIALAEAGAEVVLVNRTAPDLQDVANSIGRIGNHSEQLVYDVTDRQKFDRYIQAHNSIY